MIDPIKSVGALKAVQLAGIERVRERIAEIEERFGIAGDNSFQSTLEREMKKAQRADRAKAAQSPSQSKTATELNTVERAVDAVGVNGAANTQNAVNAQMPAADTDTNLYDAELVSEFDDLETFVYGNAQANEDAALNNPLPGSVAVNPFAPAAAAPNPTPSPNTIREPLTVVEGAVVTAPLTTEEMIEAAAAKYSVDPNLVKAIATAESNWDQSAISPVGAVGVMQLMPETAAVLGVNPYDEQQNIDGGTKYIRQLLDNFGGNVRHAVAAYNAGPGAVQRYGGVPPYSETQNYVGRVLDLYE